ncbi:hypothetical protein ABZZ20_32570 [Streptomyces sp. NPDC006430]|uniref:hypothetical protein n=1 Tax=Streptomyces sp. NPDC006430 TaxID=3154299 RepID=UPI0033A34FE6
MRMVSVDVSDLDPDRSYGLCVHVDLSGTGALQSGDVINTQSLPVPPGARTGW